jgi:uncharacterized protein (DUF2267 family)
MASAFEKRLETIEQLIKDIEATADPHVRTAARELVRVVMELHGAGIERMIQIVSASDGEATLDKMGRDELVSSLLVLYGLHPVPMEQRVQEALETVNRKMQARGAHVALLSLDASGAVAQLHAKGDVAALKEMVLAAVYQAAPDLPSFAVEGADAAFVPLEKLMVALR